MEVGSRPEVLVFRIAWVLILVAGCGRLGYDSLASGDAGPEGADAEDLSTASITIERLPEGWGTADLTREGPLDWLVLGYESSAIVHRKDIVAELISEPNTIGVGSTFFVQDDSFTETLLQWSDGKPTASAGPMASTGYVDTGELTGDGWTLSAPSQVEARTLRLFAGVYCGRLRAEATFDDGSVVPVVDTGLDTELQSTVAVSRYDIRFHNPAASQLVVRLTMDINYCTTDDLGEVWLSAVTLAD